MSVYESNIASGSIAVFVVVGALSPYCGCVGLDSGNRLLIQTRTHPLRMERAAGAPANGPVELQFDWATYKPPTHAGAASSGQRNWDSSQCASRAGPLSPGRARTYARHFVSGVADLPSLSL